VVSGPPTVSYRGMMTGPPCRIECLRRSAVFEDSQVGVGEGGGRKGTADAFALGTRACSAGFWLQCPLFEHRVLGAVRGPAEIHASPRRYPEQWFSRG
jgi:hypothetical protein